MSKPRVILDSGAYTAYKKGIKIDIDKYAEYVKTHKEEFFDSFTLDHIGTGEENLKSKSKSETDSAQLSYRNWKHLKEQGADTIPIYHLGEDEIWLQKYLKQTDYIGIGAIANLDSNKRKWGLDVMFKKYFTDSKGKPTVRIHGLGITDIELMVRYPWFSVDSFTPVISAVWGSVLLPRERDGKLNYLEMEICHISNQSKFTTGSSGSFSNYPKRLQERYVQLFEENGFELGKLHYQKKRPTRKDKRKIIEINPLEPMFDLTEESDVDVRTIANHWEERMRWNLTYWTKLRGLIPVNMFMGVSTTTHLGIFELVKPKLDILISYAYMSDDIYKAIRRYVR